VLWVFWKRTHAWMPLAAVGVALMRRSRLAPLLVVPYAIHSVPAFHGPQPRGRLRALSEWPARVVIDATEVAALVWGSIRHRRLFV